MNHSRHLLSFTRALTLLACLGLSSLSFAQGFSALISPPRFEDTAQPGSVYRNIIEITNVSTQPSRFSIATSDWRLTADGSAEFIEGLMPNSCRPWVAIEAREISVAANAKRRYRFEVQVPAAAAPGECRFAIMVEGEPQIIPGAQVALPVSGRIGVIVYLTIGNGSAHLKMLGTTTQVVEGKTLPAIKVSNSGNVHARLEGMVKGTDASGRKFSFTPSAVPILPGETRVISLTPQEDSPGQAAPNIIFPISLEGRVDFANQHMELKETINK